MIWQSDGSRNENLLAMQGKELVDRGVEDALRHIQQLAGVIGPRGSCTDNERRASEYVRVTYTDIGLDAIEIQEFPGSPAAYARYALAFGLALLSQLLVITTPLRWVYALAAVAHGLACIAMYRESDFQSNWTHWFIQSRPSQNVLARCAARDRTRRIVVVTSHVDSHRTPFFNSNASWQRIYNVAFRSLFASLLLGSATACLLVGFDALWLKILFHCTGGLVLLGCFSCIHAERTPHSPGAYDNASGVGCTLALAQILKNAPLKGTDCWFVVTGCEETGAGGMQALLQARADIWRDALWLNLDQTGIGGLYIRLREGILRQYHSHPRALSLAKEAAEATGIQIRQRVSQAYSDAAIAHKMKYPAISLGASPVIAGLETPRHQLNDLPEVIEPETLSQTLRFVLGLLTIWDEAEGQHAG